MTNDDLPDVIASDGNRWTWAAYLGASWTWCIGMFLPVLLIRDYGQWGWVIFAVPNVVGAAAMGWVMRSAAMSRQYAVDHAAAGRLFSFVTIAFQTFFALWMLPRLVGPVGYVGAAVLVQSAFTPLSRSAWLRAGGIVSLSISAALAVGLTRADVLAWPPRTTLLAGDAVGLSLVCLAGFLTCPYLDLTFLRARRSTGNADAKFTFGVGFGVLFASMIVLTFFYAGRLIPLVGASPRESLGLLARWLLVTHWLVQMTYTVHVHAAELRLQSDARDDAGTMRSGLGVWLAVALAGGLAAAFAAEQGVTYGGRSIGEAGYRVFMSAYGLLFPTYVLLAIGGRRVATLPWLAIAAAASPFYWMAFLEGRMAWATAGVAVILGGVAIVRAVTRPASALPSE